MVTYLFENKESRNFFDSRVNDVIKNIESFSDQKILTCDFDKWVEYYFETYKLQPLSFLLESATPKLSETRVERRNYSRSFTNDRETIPVNGYKVSFSIPFYGDRELLNLKPSKTILTRFPVDSISEGKTAEYGIILFSLNYTKSELDGKEKDFITTQFKSKFESYTTLASYVNDEVEQYNQSFPNKVMDALDRRKQKAHDFNAISEKFSIPLVVNPNAPNTTPISLKKSNIKKSLMPKEYERTKDNFIEQSDYENIQRVIYQSGSSMEKTARTHAKLEEEELRDVILATLNTHYTNMATGETFSKVGKVDIRIQFENKAAYIAECKIWHGEKHLESALKQLFSYSTWRDSKMSLIVFNKSNKDFENVLNKIERFLRENSLIRSSSRTQHNEWICEFFRGEETTECVKVHIVVFDLFLQNKQFE